MNADLHPFSSVPAMATNPVVTPNPVCPVVTAGVNSNGSNSADVKPSFAEPAAVADAPQHSVAAVGLISGSCGDDEGQVGDPADAAGVRSGSVTLRAKQAAENGSKVGALQTSVSPVFSGQTLSIKTGQASGPQDSIPDSEGNPANGKLAAVVTSPATAVFPDEQYKRPPGLSLLFCSRAEIEAAPAAEREAYYRIVDGLVSAPEAYGFRRETAADLDADEAVDRRVSALNNDWNAP
jgi:hypothetical protein